MSLSVLSKIFNLIAKFKYNLLQVSEIRNELSHMGLEVSLDDYTVKQYFQDMERFVDCLATLHPQHFTASQDIKARLREVRFPECSYLYF